MLYNKDWEKPKTKPDPLSLDGLIAWLQTKNPWQRYHFCDSSHCMLAQWVQSIDPNARNVIYPNNSYVYQVHGEIVDFRYTPLCRVASNQTNTFGDALEKAKKYRRQSNA